MIHHATSPDHTSLLQLPAMRELLRWMAFFRSQSQAPSFAEVHETQWALTVQLVEELERWQWQKPRIDLALYAVCAGIDEAVMSRPDRLADQWAGKPLQLIRFGEYTAGRGFFERLENIRQPQPFDGYLMECYWLVLTHGFEGQLTLRANNERLGLIEALRRELMKNGVLPAENVGETPLTIPAPVRSSHWFWAVPLMWLLTVAAMIALYVYTDKALDKHFSDFKVKASRLETQSSREPGNEPTSAKLKPPVNVNALLVGDLHHPK